MPEIDPISAQAVQPELLAGERILWAGRPAPGALVRRTEELFLIPFTLVWSGTVVSFAYSALTAERHPPAPFLAIVVLFVLAGFYFLCGRFAFAAWKKKRTWYAVTSLRVITVQNGVLGRHVASSFLSKLPAVALSGSSGGKATIRFGERPSFFSSRGEIWDPMWIGDFPAFIDVAQAGAIHRLILNAQNPSAPHV